MIKYLFGMLALVSSAVRADVYCNTVPSGTYVSYSGDVVVYNTSVSEYTQVCNLNNAWKGVSPATCFAWFSATSTAAVQGKPLTIYYPAINACSQVGVYGGSIAPHYIMSRP